MRLRPYTSYTDFQIISTWITDERTHALWSAGRFPFPMTEEGFETALKEAALRSGDHAFVATEDDGKVVGFFCYSVNTESNEGMLKFVMVDNSLRGKGYGRLMLELAVKYAFEITNVDMVHLNVFSVNTAAKKCYLNAGFTERNVTDNAFTYNGESWGRCNMARFK